MRHRPYAYAYWADLYCAACGHNLPEIDPEGNPKHPIYSWELNDLAADGADICGECHTNSEDW